MKTLYPPHEFNDRLRKIVAQMEDHCQCSECGMTASVSFAFADLQRLIVDALLSGEQPVPRPFTCRNCDTMLFTNDGGLCSFCQRLKVV